MKRYIVAIPVALFAALGVAAATDQPPRVKAPATTAPVASHASPTASVESQTALVKQYCAGCHNDRSKTGGLSLASFDASAIEKHPELTEKMIRKLRTGMMPPAGAKRPDEATLLAFVSS